MLVAIRWLGTHFAEVIAICALAFTAYQAFLQRKQSRVSVRPLVTTFVNRNREGNVGHMEFILMNNGLGPAFINCFQVYVGGKTCELDGAVADLLRDVPVIRTSVTTLADDYAMPASTAKTLLAVTFPCRTQEELEKMAGRLNVLDLELRYSSAYRERFAYDSREFARARLDASTNAQAALPKENAG